MRFEQLPQRIRHNADMLIDANHHVGYVELNVGKHAKPISSVIVSFVDDNGKLHKNEAIIIRNGHLKDKIYGELTRVFGQVSIEEGKHL